MHLDNQFRRAIADAALKGDLESVKRLSKGADHYKGAFYRAAAHDHLKIVKYLIEFPGINDLFGNIYRFLLLRDQINFILAFPKVYYLKQYTFDKYIIKRLTEFYEHIIKM